MDDIEQQAQALLVIERGLLKKLISPINCFDLSNRLKNAFVLQGIHYIGDIVTQSRADFKRSRNIGEFAVQEVEKKVLQPQDLDFGTNVPGWPQLVAMIYADRDAEIVKRGQVIERVRQIVAEGEKTIPDSLAAASAPVREYASRKKQTEFDPTTPLGRLKIAGFKRLTGFSPL